MVDFTAQALCAIDSHQMIENGDTVIVACSGGADSVALLHFLFCHAKTLGIVLRAAHVNHGLRGKAADADEAFVASLCTAWGIALDVTRLVPQGVHSEDLCRQQRYAFFESISKRHACAKVATAHTQNDNVETILLHLARGAGLQGVCGIPAVRGNIIRPLLTVTRVQIEKYVAQSSLSFCTDATNAQPDYARNRVRHAALPALESVNPQVHKALARFSQHAMQTVQYMQLQAKELLFQAKWANCVGETGYRADVLAQAHPALRIAALHSLIAPYADITQARLTRADQALCEKSGVVQLSQQRMFSVTQGIVRIVPTTDAVAHRGTSWERPLLIENDAATQILTLPAGYLLRISVNSYEKTVNFMKQEENPLKFVADYGKITGNAIFRTGRVGDAFTPAWGNGTKALKKLYSEAKLSALARKANPVLASVDKVLWVAGFGFARSVAPDEATQQCLRIEIKSGFVSHNTTGGIDDEQRHGS